MSFLHPLALRLEHFVYDGICALSGLADRDGDRGTRRDPLASADDAPHTESRRW